MHIVGYSSRTHEEGTSEYFDTYGGEDKLWEYATTQRDWTQGWEAILANGLGEMRGGKINYIETFEAYDLGVVKRDARDVDWDILGMREIFFWYSLAPTISRVGEPCWLNMFGLVPESRCRMMYLF